MRFLILFLFVFLFTVTGEAKQPLIASNDVVKKTAEIMKAHAVHKEFTPLIAQRALKNYIENLDPTKTYFLESDVNQWIEPSDDLIEKVVKNYQTGHFETFFEIQAVFQKRIETRQKLNNQLDLAHLPENVHSKEFKEMKWVKTDEELLNRIRRIWSLQIKTASQLSEEMREKSIQRILKRQAKNESDALSRNPQELNPYVLSNILKAVASSLDAYTAYFTPDEATQFMMNVQQRMHGIGAMLRDDLNGFSIIKLVEGGPAALSKELKVKDRIVAVNGEPVVGMDIEDAVNLIRGETNTPAHLTIIRETPVSTGDINEEKIEITILRGEVILKESRYKSSYIPYGDGIIGYLQLYSFYEDHDSSSSSDLKKEIEELKKEHRLLGLILDLRYNTGGLLTEAVRVSGLFISNGVVVSIKDEHGRVQHLRNTEGTPIWDGPLIIETNRMTASASEIVAQTLQDYGRALVVGDDRTFGKGSFQTLTLSTDDEVVDPQGEYKVTRGRYYTVSGKTPQLLGVIADIVVPGSISESEIGEVFGKYPLEGDQIKSNFEETSLELPFSKKDQKTYLLDHQKRLKTYVPYIDTLKINSAHRIEQSCNYQNFLREVKKKDREDTDEMEDFGQNDPQLDESYAIMKDLILMMKEDGFYFPSRRE